jgi:1,4-alpha-glucan branching enzyme
LPDHSTRYHLRARYGEKVVDLDDPYRFPPMLTDFDLYLLGEGTHLRLYEKLAAHPLVLDIGPVPWTAIANARRCNGSVTSSWR